MGKKKGKAKRKSEEFDIHFLPPPCRKLTPERAKKWLREDFHTWQELVEQCSRERDFDASYLSVSIGYMVTACERAIDSGREVLLTADEFEIPSEGIVPRWSKVLEPIGVMEAAISAPGDATDLDRIREPLLAIVGWLKEIAEHGQREQRQQFERVRQQCDALPPDPDEFKAIEAERDVAVDAVTKPWEEKIEALKAREIESDDDRQEARA